MKLMEYWQLKQRQSLPLSAKIIHTENIIRQWYDYWNGDVYVSFSGGKDSTVLLSLVRDLYPKVPAVFIDTGLEYPEIRSFVRTINNVIWIKPKIKFQEVITKYGYPVISKETAQKIEDIRNTHSESFRHKRLFGANNKFKSGKLAEKWKFLLDAPFKISSKCCNKLKKDPIKIFERKTGLKPFIGLLAADSLLRRQKYLRDGGCNNFKGSRVTSNPLSIWLEQDIYDYIKLKNISICSIYSKGYNSTGCVFCLFGIHLSKNNKVNLLKLTHPKMYNYCRDHLGLEKVISYILSETYT